MHDAAAPLPSAFNSTACGQVVMPLNLATLLCIYLQSRKLHELKVFEAKIPRPQSVQVYMHVDSYNW
jgi:hypothetical protein